MADRACIWIRSYIMYIWSIRVEYKTNNLDLGYGFLGTGSLNTRHDNWCSVRRRIAAATDCMTELGSGLMPKWNSSSTILGSRKCVVINILRFLFWFPYYTIPWHPCADRLPPHVTCTLDFGSIDHGYSSLIEDEVMYTLTRCWTSSNPSDTKPSNLQELVWVESIRYISLA